MTTEPTTTNQTKNDDLINPPKPTSERHFFGEIVTVDDFDCVLRKGSRPLPFDPGQHRPDERRIHITIEMQCEKRDGSHYPISQPDINTGSKWRKTVESLRALGVQTRQQVKELKGKWAHVKLIPTDRTYTAKKTNDYHNAGDQVPEMAWSFVTLFDNAEQCKEAEKTFYTPRNDGQGAGMQETSLPPTAADDQMHKFLLDSLPLLWKIAKGDYEVFGKQLAANSQYAAHGITLESDVIKQLTGQAPF